MYNPQHFREERTEVLIDAICSIRLAALVTATGEGLEVTHLPLLPRQADDGSWCLDGHMARPNPHWRTGPGAPTVAIFQGPHAYVTPALYPGKREHGKVVPTWNYVVVHAHGALTAHDDAQWLRRHLDDLTDAAETKHAEAGRIPWRTSDAPDGYIEAVARGTVGISLAVSRFDGKWKLSQNRAPADRLGVAAGFAAATRTDEQAVAEAMRAAGLAD